MPSIILRIRGGTWLSEGLFLLAAGALVARRGRHLPTVAQPRSGQAFVAGLVAIAFFNIFWSKTSLGLLRNTLPFAHDTTEAVFRSAGLINSAACLAALAGMAWLQFASARPTTICSRASGYHQ